MCVRHTCGYRKCFKPRPPHCARGAVGAGYRLAGQLIPKHGRAHRSVLRILFPTHYDTFSSIESRTFIMNVLPSALQPELLMFPVTSGMPEMSADTLTCDQQQAQPPQSTKVKEVEEVHPPLPPAPPPALSRHVMAPPTSGNQVDHNPASRGTAPLLEDA